MVEISVIIPAYNAIDYMDESLDSIINQSFKDLEIICVDDGSTDNTLERLRIAVFKYTPRRIRVLEALQTQDYPKPKANIFISWMLMIFLN